MGKEWYWSSSGSRSSTSKRGPGGGGGDKDTSVGTTTTTTSNTTTTPSGCMSAVFHFFDFHHFQFPLHHHHHHHSSFKSSLPVEEGHTVLKGVEAPRNSLELEETPLSTILKEEEEEENLKFPMGIQIKTSTTNNNGDTRSKSLASNYDSSSEISSSPSAKTPNLVARLMGLDLLPEINSPSSSSSSFHEPTSLPTKLNLHHHLRPRQPLQNRPFISHRKSMEVDITGSRSLPETPRISSARRSDVDHHHRLSLQINKENDEDLEFSKFSYLRRKEIKQEDESRSPSHCARQIVQQVKVNVSRKVGLDITNTLRGRPETLQTSEEVFSPLKTKKSSSRALNKLVSDQTTSPGKHSTPSCSPRLSRFLEPKQKPVTTTPTSTTYTTNNNNKDHKIQAQHIRVVSSKPRTQPVQEQQSSHNSEQRPAKKCKKLAGSSERFSTPPRLKKPPKTTDVIRNKQEEPFVRPSTTNRANKPDKDSKKTPFSNALSNITVPTLLPVKKNPSPPATKIPQKQVLLNAQSSKHSSGLQLPSNSSQISYKQEATHTLIARDNIDDRSNGVATTTSTTTVGGAEHEYITRILKRTGLDKHTPVSFITWFSSSHPLDPSIFQHLENTTNSTSDSGQLSLLGNRKLLFQLVDEVLVDVLKPVIDVKPWCNVIWSSSWCGRGRRYGSMHGSDLVDTLCLVIGKFPCADCRVLEDIDGLIDSDLPKTKLQNKMAFEEEGEGVVMDVEKDILDSLIHETALEFGQILF